MPDARLLWIPVAALLAYAFKASTGFGSAIVLVALGFLYLGCLPTSGPVREWRPDDRPLYDNQIASGT